MKLSIQTAGLFAILGLSGIGAVGQEQEYPLPGKNLADEPVARSFSTAKAAAWLDSVAINWTRQRKCGTCHTNVPYLWARPSLKSFESSAMGEVRGFFERIADTWDPDKPFRKFKVASAWECQLIGAAVTLAVHDSRTTRRLHPITRKALDRTWTLQRPDGAWDWPKCDWPPMEHDDYYGATFVAFGVGSAPDNYAASEPARQGLGKLRQYLKTHAAPDLHHRIMLLWASTTLDGLMSQADRDAVVRDLFETQKKDGGWCLPSFGGWKRHDDSPNSKESPSDGYATGLAVVVLRAAGLPADHAQIRRAVDWLKSNQRESGRWFTKSLSIDEQHFVTHVGTAYAVMALDACGELRE